MGFYFLNMTKSTTEKNKYYHKVLGVIFIIIGIIFYLTPIPGTTFLIILGFVLFIGKNKTLDFFKKILSSKTLKFLKIKKIVKEI